MEKRYLLKRKQKAWRFHLDDRHRDETIAKQECDTLRPLYSKSGLGGGGGGGRGGGGGKGVKDVPRVNMSAD